MVNPHWMSAVAGLHYLKEGLESFCDDVVTNQHKRLMAKCGSSCTRCELQTLKPNHTCIVENNIKRCPLGLGKCNCLKPYHALVQCPNETCGIIYDEIISIHGSTPPAPNWMNTDITQWYSNPWAIATCFIKANGYLGRTCAAEFDCSGLLSIIINDKAFLDHLEYNIDGNDAFTKKLKEGISERKIQDTYNETLLRALKLLQSVESDLLVNEREGENATSAIKDFKVQKSMLEAAVISRDHSRAISLLVTSFENIWSLKQGFSFLFN